MTHEKAIFNIRLIEEYSKQSGLSLHPVSVFINCLAFIFVVVSFPKYSLSRLLPMFLYPIYLFYASRIPMKPILARMLPSLPLVLGLGLFNPILDRNMITIADITISAGFVSYFSLIVRCCLCVGVSLLTISIIGADGVSEAMRFLRVPKVFITQFILTFRYIQTLAEEAGTIVLSYKMRAAGKRAPAINEWGALVGGWLLRTLKRADRIYKAMLLRGFEGTLPHGKVKSFRAADVIFVIACCLGFLLVRIINIPNLIGEMVM